MEFLVRFRWTVPAAMAATDWADIRAAERVRGGELMRAGKMVRLWRLPGQRGAIGVFEVSDADELDELLGSFPMHPYMDIVVEPLAHHPLEAQVRAGP